MLKHIMHVKGRCLARFVIVNPELGLTVFTDPADSIVTFKVIMVLSKMVPVFLEIN